MNPQFTCARDFSSSCCCCCRPYSSHSLGKSIVRVSGETPSPWSILQRQSSVGWPHLGVASKVQSTAVLGISIQIVLCGSPWNNFVSSSMSSGTHLTVNPHTVVSPYLRSQGISSRVACRNGGAVTNLWGLGTATTISDSESPIYIVDISEYVSFPASSSILTLFSLASPCACASNASITLKNSACHRTGHVPRWLGSTGYFGLIMSPFWVL